MDKIDKMITKWEEEDKKFKEEKSKIIDILMHQYNDDSVYNHVMQSKGGDYKIK